MSRKSSRKKRSKAASETARVPDQAGAEPATASKGVGQAAQPSRLQRLLHDPRGRRRTLQWLGGLGLASLGAVAIARHDARSRTLHDLSVIGAGEPVVVQVHDPSCPLCRKLMATTRAVLEDMPGIRYRVADLTSSQGRAFGEEHRAGKVTLILLDGRGRSVGRIEGVTPAQTLRQSFEQRLGPADS